jgi:hypothetical protein
MMDDITGLMVVDQSFGNALVENTSTLGFDTYSFDRLVGSQRLEKAGSLILPLGRH